MRDEVPSAEQVSSTLTAGLLDWRFEDLGGCMSESVELARDKEVEWRRIRGSSSELLSTSATSTLAAGSAFFARLAPAKGRSGELLFLTRGGRLRSPSFLIAGEDSLDSRGSEGGGGRERTASRYLESLRPVVQNLVLACPFATIQRN